MRSNRLQEVWGFTCFGESHGTAMGIVIEDIQPGVEFPYSELNQQLAFRKPNQNPYATSRNEPDDYQIVSGVFEGKTTGTPICILFWNQDIRSDDYAAIKDVFRPGHGDYTWYHKFKIYDYRGGGRASGRETICRITASAMVDHLLGKIKISFQTIRIGQLVAAATDVYTQINHDNPFCWNDPTSYSELYPYLDKIKAEQDTVGGIVKLRIDPVPVGLGEPVFAKLSAHLAQAIMSIGSVKGIAFGSGFDLGAMTGSEANDQSDASGWLSNHAGGILGGISSGQPIIITIAVKPIASHGKSQVCMDKSGNPVTLQISGRHDVCHIPRLLPVIEAMVKLVLADAISHQKLIAGDSLDMDDYREALDKLDEDLLLTLCKRKAIVAQVKTYKTAHNLDFRDTERERAMALRWQTIATELGLEPEIAISILQKALELCRN